MTTDRDEPAAAPSLYERDWPGYDQPVVNPAVVPGEGAGPAEE